MAALAVIFLFAGDANATSQAARKTGLDCSTCHQGFPRLNSFGEAYMRAGYTIPDLVSSSDDAKGSKSPKRLVLDSVSDYFGVRLNVDAASWADGGTGEDSVAFGNDKWSQFFIMGPIGDKFSFFTEIEITTKKTHHSWWKLGWHPNRRVNVVLGNQSPLDHSAFSNRLRILPAVKSAGYGLKVSNGLGVNSVNASSARKGIQLHGELTEDLIYYTGISNGSGNESDLINYWGGLRYYIPTDGAFEGTSFSLTHYEGADMDDATMMIQNDYDWLMPAFNLRYNGLDLQVYSRMVNEDNRSFDPTPGVMSEDYDSWGATVGWMFRDATIQPALQYDKIDASMFTSEVETLVAALSYFPRDNLRAAIYYQSDLVGDADKAFINLRMMF
jgi:hypothetical protein